MLHSFQQGHCVQLIVGFLSHFVYLFQVGSIRTEAKGVQPVIEGIPNIGAKTHLCLFEPFPILIDRECVLCHVELVAVLAVRCEEKGDEGEEEAEEAAHVRQEVIYFGVVAVDSQHSCRLVDAEGHQGGLDAGDGDGMRGMDVQIRASLTVRVWRHLRGKQALIGHHLKLSNKHIPDRPSRLRKGHHDVLLDEPGGGLLLTRTDNRVDHVEPHTVVVVACEVGAHLTADLCAVVA